MLKLILESRQSLSGGPDPHRESGSLHELFHENTKCTRAHALAQAARIGAHLHSRQAVQATSRHFKVYRFAEKIGLPGFLEPGISFSEVLRHRVSTRVFSGQPITLDTLAAVLVPAAACNRTAAVKHFPPIELNLRSYPSGGAEFPVEIYPVLLRVGGVAPSITHFDPRARALSVLSSGISSDRLAPCLIDAEAILRAAAVLVVLTAIFDRSTAKYGDRGYRLILLEAGHLAQNLCLGAAAAGLASLAWGGYYDDELHRLIGVDGVNEAVVHSLFIGGKAP